MARYAYASSSARWRSGRYGPMRRTSAVSMKSGSSSSTATDAADAATASQWPPRIGRTPSAIPPFAADRYDLECCERRARSGINVSYSRLGRSRNSEMRLSVPSSACLVNTTSSSTFTFVADSSLLTTVALAFALASASTGASLPDLIGLAPASAVELTAGDFFAFLATTAASDLAPVLETLVNFAKSVPLPLA
uniref:Uncharacterized protein n=1 Tax=Zea mays TaxID=4577 RepID=A0A804LNJ0_MAIZE